MLSIGKLVLGQQRYYDQQVARGQDDYYSGRGEAPGEWIGAGADTFGLTGRVSADQFTALLSGNDPRNPEAPLTGWRPSKVAALDLTFSAPKSVSVLYAVADAGTAAEIVAAHESAVRASLAWLEHTAVEVRRGAGGQHTLPGAGFIAAAYRHRMSRALDPQLHTHVVAANMTEGPDGRYTALNGTALYRSAKTAGYLYQAHLRAELADRLGLEWGPVHKGAAELRDIPATVLAEFSRRRHEMLDAAAAGGFSLTTKRSAEVAALGTRERKRYGIDTHTWREEIQARAGEHGLTRAAVGQLLDRARNQPLQPNDEHDPTETRHLEDRLAGPVGLTERSNTFDDRAVLQEFAGAATQGARVPTLTARAAAFAARDDVLATAGEQLTTTDLVACERRLIDAAVSRAKTGCGLVPTDQAATAIAAADRPLTAGQHTVLAAVLCSGNGVDVVEALAGTGKTYTAGVLRQVYESAGYEVLGLAPTGRAARELTDDAGIPARTIDRALIDIEEHDRQLPARAVIVLDEAGMAPTRLTARLLEHAAQAGAKVIAIGDSGQLPSVLAGGWLRAVGERIGAQHLTEVMRQQNPAERRALGALHDGSPHRFLAWAVRNDRIQLTASHELHDRAISLWIDSTDPFGIQETVMIARDNDTREQLNEAARQHRRAVGDLSDERTFGSVDIAVGDRVICRDNDARIGVENGTRGTVSRLNTDGIVIETDSGFSRELPARYVADHVEHAYCLTGHGIQGGTMQRAIVVASPSDLTRGWSYSALSRARGETTLLIADSPRHIDDRADVAPDPGFRARDRATILAAVARRMLVRDDQDLAVNQLPASDRAEEPHPEPDQPVSPDREQDHGDKRLASLTARNTYKRLIDLRNQISQTELSLAAIPHRGLERLDELDAKHRETSERLDDHRRQLEALPQPRRRLGRLHDPAFQQRDFLTRAISLDEQQIADLQTARTQQRHSIGDPDRARSERDGLRTQLTVLRRDYTTVREQLVDQTVDRRPDWLTKTLGEPPERATDRAIWDAAARELAGFRLDHDVTDHRAALGPQPSQDRDAQRHWQRAEATLERAQRQLGRQVSTPERDISLGVG